MTRAWPGALFVALAMACGGGSGAPATTTATATEPTPTPFLQPSPTAEPPPAPALLFISSGSSGNVVHRVTLTEGGLADEQLPFAVPFAEMSLSPSGFLLAYVEPGVESGIVLVDVVHATQQEVSGTAVSRTRPFWSIDGEYVAARAPDNDRTVVWWRNTVSGTDAETDLGELTAADLRWLPDAQGFSYVSDGQAGVFEIGAGHRTLAADERYEVREVAFAPDGTRAALARVQEPPDPTPTAVSSQTPSPDASPTGTATPFDTPTPGQEPSETPTATPSLGLAWSLAVVSREGEVLAELVPGFAEISKLRWISSREGALGFVGTGATGTTGLWMLEPGRAPQLVYQGRVDDAAWSHDGLYVAIVADGGVCGRTCPRGYLRVVELATGTVFGIDRDRVLGPPAWERPLSGP